MSSLFRFQFRHQTWCVVSVIISSQSILHHSLSSLLFDQENKPYHTKKRPLKGEPNSSI